MPTLYAFCRLECVMAASQAQQLPGDMLKQAEQMQHLQQGELLLPALFGPNC